MISAWRLNLPALEDFSLINNRYEAPAAPEAVVKVSSDGELEETALHVLQQLIR